MTSSWRTTRIQRLNFYYGVSGKTNTLGFPWHTCLRQLFSTLMSDLLIQHNGMLIKRQRRWYGWDLGDKYWNDVEVVEFWIVHMVSVEEGTTKWRTYIIGLHSYFVWFGKRRWKRRGNNIYSLFSCLVCNRSENKSNLLLYPIMHACVSVCVRGGRESRGRSMRVRYFWIYQKELRTFY